MSSRIGPGIGLYASTACIPGSEPLLDRVNRYLRAGISGIELGAGISSVPETPDGLKEIGCDLLIHNYFPPPPEPFVLNLASRSPEIRSMSLELAVNAMNWCKQVGAPFYSVHGGFITDPEGHRAGTFVFPHPKSTTERDRALSTYVDSIELLLETAERLDVDVVVENNVCYPEHAGKLLLQTTDDFIELFDRIDNSRLGILLDTGHLNVSRTTLGFDRRTFSTRHSDRIRAIHMHDNDGSADQHLPASTDSWIFDVIGELRPTLKSIIVEAKFESVESLAEYVSWLGSRLNERGQ